MLQADNCLPTFKGLQFERNKITGGPKIVLRPVKVTRFRTTIKRNRACWSQNCLTTIQVEDLTVNLKRSDSLTRRCIVVQPVRV